MRHLNESFFLRYIKKAVVIWGFHVNVKGFKGGRQEDDLSNHPNFDYLSRINVKFSET